jgi:hypothetical protein
VQHPPHRLPAEQRTQWCGCVERRVTESESREEKLRPTFSFRSSNRFLCSLHLDSPGFPLSSEFFSPHSPLPPTSDERLVSARTLRALVLLAFSSPSSLPFEPQQRTKWCGCVRTLDLTGRKNSGRSGVSGEWGAERSGDSRLTGGEIGNSFRRSFRRFLGVPQRRHRAGAQDVRSAYGLDSNVETERYSGRDGVALPERRRRLFDYSSGRTVGRASLSRTADTVGSGGLGRVARQNHSRE